MSALATSLFTNLEAALSGAAPLNLSTLPAAAPIETPEDRRAAWRKQRWGKFTASEFHRLMTNPKSGTGLSKGAQTYAKEKAVELLTECNPDTYTSPAMQWGIDHELQAVERFKTATGLSLHKTGDDQEFLTLGDDIGGTPDGLIVDSLTGVEIKCPNSTTHMDYLAIEGAESLKEIAPDYYWQCQGLMLINRASAWYFISYDPRFINPGLQLHYMIIQRSEEDIQRLRVKLAQAVEYRDEILGRVL